MVSLHHARFAGCGHFHLSAGTEIPPAERSSRSTTEAVRFVLTVSSRFVSGPRLCGNKLIKSIYLVCLHTTSCWRPRRWASSSFHRLARKITLQVSRWSSLRKTGISSRPNAALCRVRFCAHGWRCFRPRRQSPSRPNDQFRSMSCCQFHRRDLIFMSTEPAAAQFEEINP